MSESGFFQQKRRSPTSFALVLALHTVVLGAVIMVKGPPMAPPEIIPDIFDVPLRPPPPEDVPPPPELPRVQQTRIDRPTPEIPLPPLPETPQLSRVDPLPPESLGAGTVTSLPQPDPVPVREPVRRGASVDPRYASALQPPYPLSEQRAQRTGTVQIEVTIGTDGRVRAVRRVSATSDAFWEVAERQARTRWRFRPATVDGRPVESTKIMTVYFRLEDV